mmetsp:Transcript_5987/g.18898  ORF Transcript_5987/g.18898 Transcript_5987/m.18898 type:complete len:140 (-) Transcript_5987:14-433(-)
MHWNAISGRSTPGGRISPMDFPPTTPDDVKNHVEIPAARDEPERLELTAEVACDDAPRWQLYNPIITIADVDGETAAHAAAPRGGCGGAAVLLGNIGIEFLTKRTRSIGASLADFATGGEVACFIAELAVLTLGEIPSG